MLYNDDISNEELGEKVKAAHLNHLLYIQAMRPSWLAEGRNFRKVREDLKVSRRELSTYIGISDQVIAKFENGQSIRSRTMLKHSYKTSLQLIQLKRNNFVDLIKK